MCSHYQTLKDAELLLKKFGAPNKPAGGKYDMWPRYPGVFVRRPVEHDAGDEAVPGLAAEPCVIERDQMTAELLEAPDKLRKGMAPR
jgi:hypothetical protein